MLQNLRNGFVILNCSANIQRRILSPHRTQRDEATSGAISSNLRSLVLFNCWKCLLVSLDIYSLGLKYGVKK